MKIPPLKAVIATATLATAALVGTAIAPATATAGVIHGCNPPPIATGTADPHICFPIEG